MSVPPDRPSTTRPPPPPPPPSNPLSKQSSTVLKLRTVPASQRLYSKPHSPKNTHPPPTGPYFFYGTLQNPSLLVKILGLNTGPDLRPALIEGFQYKMWGKYPALLADQGGGGRIEGVVFEVGSTGDAEKLAAYETSSYTVGSCVIHYLDGREPGEQTGWVFVFDGNWRDLREGFFQLE